MKTAISVPDTTFERVDAAASRLGFSRSEFYARAAERWLAKLDDDGTTAAIDRALAVIGDEDDNHEFLEAAAHHAARRSSW